MGNNGIDGLSAYQIWINNGNSGTESDFIISSKELQGHRTQDLLELTGPQTVQLQVAGPQMEKCGCTKQTCWFIRVQLVFKYRGISKMDKQW